MCNSGDIKKKNILSGIWLLLVFCIIHILVVPDYGDDVKFVKIMERYGYNIFQVLYHRYNTWSSRIFIEFFDFIVPCFPVYIWKVSDIIFCLLLWRMSLVYIKDGFLSALCLLAYPFFHMGSAGWQVTTVVYLWTFVVWLAVVSGIKSDKKGILCIVAGTAVATNMEVLAVIHILVSGMWLFYLVCFQDNKVFLKPHGSIPGYIKDRLNKNPVMKKLSVSLVVALLNLLNALLCPGNSIRKIKGASKEFPAFFETSFWDRLRICIASTIEHFTSVPDAIFITISVMAGVLCYQRVKGYKRYIGFVPAIICTALTIYFFITRIIKTHTVSYLRPDVAACTGSTEYIMQWVMVAFGIIYLAAMLWSLVCCCDGLEERYLVAGVYCIGLIGRFVLLFSPTMVASGTRVYFYFYMSMVFCIGRLMGKVKNKKITNFLLLVLLSGVVMNVLVIAIKGH